MPAPLDPRSITRRRQAVALSGESLVTTRPLNTGSLLPLMVEPATPGVSLAAWLEQHRDGLTGWLHRHGAVLFRGFGAANQADFGRVLAGLGLKMMNYIEKATPRTELGGHIYTATEFPAEYPIAPHNELSYVNIWPGRICFFCVRPAPLGGATPLVDVRRVLARIDPAILDRFRRQGWSLVRTFSPGIGPTWQHSYAVETRDALEAYLTQSAIAWEWLEDGRLRTRQMRPAIRRHPVTGEEVWFNHVAFWHVSSLPGEIRAQLVADFGAAFLPYATYYGDGTPIPDNVAEALRDAYDAETTSFAWRAGDLVVVDNMLVAHGRSTYSGPRQVLVAMGDAIEMSLSADG